MAEAAPPPPPPPPAAGLQAATSTLDAEEVAEVVRAALLGTLSDAAWEASDKAADSLTTAVLVHVLKALNGLARPYKYAVTLCAQQRVGAGLHVACGGRRDSARDVVVSVPWENATIQAVVTVCASHLGVEGAVGA